MMLPATSEQQRLELGQLRRLEVMSILEATTLILLVGVAVPLKYLAGWPSGTKVLGPVHGIAFLAYVWTVFQTVVGGGWTRGEIARLLVVAFVPLAGFANLPFLHRKVCQLRHPGASA